jgi:gluconate:H+ symporter, GntP family
LCGDHPPLASSDPVASVRRTRLWCPVRPAFLEQTVQSVNTGFGATIGQIGIVILAGAVIGKFLEKSGGAFRLSEALLALVGRSRAPLAMNIMGYVVSIPVFCDSAFVILSPLARALARRAGITLAATAVALSLGLIVSHSMVPPTPGPVAAAGLLDADLGLVILLSIPFSMVGLLAGWLFAVRWASRTEIDPGLPEEVESPESEETAPPSAFKSVLPILVPLVLIVLKSVSDLDMRPLGDGVALVLIGFVGQPVIALLIGVLISFLLPARLTRSMLSTSGWIGEAVTGAASIILITGCGGAFGRILQDSGIAEVIQRDFSGVQSLGLLLPILVGAALKSAQGSGTVAIITAAGLVAPLLDPLGLASPGGRALAVVAIGSGSIMASHVNDSYFWVVTQLSDMTVGQGYRLQTGGTLVVGLASSLAVLIAGALFF